MDQGLWCIIGEFNDLLSQEDKRGIHPHPNWLCTSFWNAIEECDITDIKLDNHHFTWHKSRGIVQMVEERLDRALSNPEWIACFPNVRLQSLVTSHSNHTPILLQCDIV